MFFKWADVIIILVCYYSSKPKTCCCVALGHCDPLRSSSLPGCRKAQARKGAFICGEGLQLSKPLVTTPTEIQTKLSRTTFTKPTKDYSSLQSAESISEHRARLSWCGRRADLTGTAINGLSSVAKQNIPRSKQRPIQTSLTASIFRKAYVASPRASSNVTRHSALSR